MVEREVRRIDELARAAVVGAKSLADAVFVAQAPMLLTLDQLANIAINTDMEKLKILHPYLNATLSRYEITSLMSISHFLAQVAVESDAFNTAEEYASGSAYEGRGDLGNVNPGDGVKFKGRGLIQITGRENYGLCGKWLGVDLVNNPEKLQQPDLACFCAGWYWWYHDLSPLAEADELTKITRAINGGLNGFDDRLYYLGRAKRTFGLI